MAKRFMFYRLVDFIDNDSTKQFALLSGLRVMGKTTILQDLRAYYQEKNVYYKNLAEVMADDEIDEFMSEVFDKTLDLVLLDEIGYLKGYETWLQALYNDNSERDSPAKIVLTSSSAVHATKLSMTKLGGRSNLFRLQPLSFLEYAVMTGRVESYEKFSDITLEHFADYLSLADADKLGGLVIQFDEAYFQRWYNEVELANKNSSLRVSDTPITADDFRIMVDLIAYSLSDVVPLLSTLNPNIGGKEFISARDESGKRKKSEINYMGTRLQKDLERVPGISTDAMCRVLSFMLWAGMLVVETVNTEETEQAQDAFRLANEFDNLGRKSSPAFEEVSQIFNRVQLNISSPLFYSLLGAEIYKRIGLQKPLFHKGDVAGKMLEIYLKAAMAMWGSGLLLTSIKLVGKGEVDICNMEHRVLLEATVSDKKANEVNVCEYYKTHPFIRVSASKTKNYCSNEHGFHFIPYPLLCCMLDNGSLFSSIKMTIPGNADKESGVAHQPKLPESLS